MNKEFSFGDVVLESSKKHNRSIKNMVKLNKSIDWNRVEDILLTTVGLSRKSSQFFKALSEYITATIFIWAF